MWNKRKRRVEYAHQHDYANFAKKEKEEEGVLCPPISPIMYSESA